MKLPAASKLLTSWVACLAFLLASAVPSFAGEPRSGARPGWIEVCSGNGPRLIKADGAPAQPDPARSPARHARHCPLCAVHVSALGPAPTTPTVVPAPALSYAVPRLLLEAPRLEFAWTARQSRAPPLTD
jgi:hypothetical protein